ncbi:hypothetical protein [Butyrivibrio sp. INlla14]|uniref:hypothetical protein n=1 Tax=Butyrivibrio sp. INlla14 TaxID=1520808 RepID=UPI000876EE83|nr:hypothetical protein [Butyrivibrio sp. INlla14]SCX97424.1 hypothetical protein SAMN02910371_00606 [Butyrivibrio sp. INlla14]
MNNLLYIYEEVLDLIRDKNLDKFEREGARDNFTWQFAEKGSSLHVQTVNQSRFVLYATENDFNLIKRKADEANLGIVIKESKKDVIELMVSQYEEVGSKAILFVRNGNKGLLQNPEEPRLPHVIYLFTNENLEFLLDCMVEAQQTKKVASTNSKSAKPIRPVRPTPESKIGIYRAFATPKVKAPELSDEEIENALPVGCEVEHARYGQGVVQTIADGKVTVLFEDLVEKTFAASVCIDKKLLKIL